MRARTSKHNSGKFKIHIVRTNTNISLHTYIREDSTKIFLYLKKKQKIAHVLLKSIR